MRSASLTKLFFLFALSVIVFMGIQACQDSNNISGPDFSTVPPPWDTTEADSTFTVGEGQVNVYVIEKGNEVFEVEPIDQISVYYTGRRTDGTVFTSTWASGNTRPRTLEVSEQIEGFELGVLGMSEGERRTIVIPPSYGYGDSRKGTNSYDLRNDTLYYDIELEEIID